MGVRRITKAGLTAVAALAVGALTASAQVVTYSTSGTLTGTGCSGNVCTVDGLTLSFQGNPTGNYLAPTNNIDLGAFVTTANPAAGTNTVGLQSFSGISFTLLITQTAPSGGTGNFSGPISGTLSYNPSSSTLFWSPTTLTTSIGLVNYALVTDQQFPNQIGISPPALGANPNNTTIRANITATPEPATFLLLAPGLAGLGLTVRLRRRSTKA
jgi:hypothetical protein